MNDQSSDFSTHAVHCLYWSLKDGWINSSYPHFRYWYNSLYICSIPSTNVTDANILAYETPPQRTYRTRAASRTAQTKRTTRNQTTKKTKFSGSEDPAIEKEPTTEDKRTPVLNFNRSKEVSMKCDNLTPNVGVSKGHTSESHVFSPPVGKPGKGHVRNKVHAYEDYIEHKSPSSKQCATQSPVPETPEQKEGKMNSEESCRETPESVSRGKRSSVRKSLKSANASRKSLLKSSKIHLNPSHLHPSEISEVQNNKLINSLFGQGKH